MLARNVVIQGIKDVSVVEREIDAENLRPHECLIETYVSLISAFPRFRSEKGRDLSGKSRLLFRREDSQKGREGISGGGRGCRLI